MQDLRYALRTLRRSPGFTLVAVLTLAIGIGANTAIFSAVNGVLLSPLAFPESNRLLALHRPASSEADISALDAADLRAASRTVSSLGLYMPYWAFDLTGSGEPERLTGSIVDADFFRALRVTPLRGRVFSATDRDARVAVISEGLWRRRFGADPGVVGRTVTLSDHPYEIIGVMPAALDFQQLGLEIWAPVAAEAAWAYQSFSRGSNNFEVVARLRAGATLGEAQAELGTITARLAREYPQTNGRKLLTATPLRGYLTGDITPALLALLGAVGLVLLIACANLSNLLLARAAGRRQELAVRVAVGASRGRLLRQLLSESLLIASSGGALGVLLALWGTDLLVAAAPATLPRADAIGVDGRVLLFSVFLTIGTGLLFGLLPARWALRVGPAAGLTGGRSSAGAGPRRLLDGIVATEMALAFLLLVGAGLLLRTFDNLRRVDLGFDPANLLVASVVLPESRYGTIEPQTRAFEAIVAAVRAIPGVDDAATVIGAPLESGGIGHSLRLFDRAPAPQGQEPGARLRPVTGDYFATLRLPVVEGRGLTPADRGGTERVAVVNETFARAFWPGRSAVGQRVAWTGIGDSVPNWMTIVGVARDVKMNNSLAGADEEAVYTPYGQRSESWQRFGTLVVRTHALPGALERQIKAAVWGVDPTLTLAGVSTMQDRRRGALAQQRFNALALAAFALAALLMAVQGIYGVLAFAVEQRRREIGIRMALGARREAVVRMVLGHGLGRVAVGLAAGLAGALALTRLLRGLLFGVGPVDALAYAGAALTLLGVAFLASWLPARSASRTDPMIALRAE
jgi:putative ABC transport system permease protein